MHKAHVCGEFEVLQAQRLSVSTVRYPAAPSRALNAPTRVRRQIGQLKFFRSGKIVRMSIFSPRQKTIALSFS